MSPVARAMRTLVVLSTSLTALITSLKKKDVSAKDSWNFVDEMMLDQQLMTPFQAGLPQLAG